MAIFGKEYSLRDTMSESSTCHEKQRVHTVTIVHREQEVLIVTFPYSTELYSKCKAIVEIFTRTQSGARMPPDDERYLLVVSYALEGNKNQTNHVVPQDWMYRESLVGRIRELGHMLKKKE